jgi:hypothetical protein
MSLHFAFISVPLAELLIGAPVVDAPICDCKLTLIDQGQNQLAAVLRALAQEALQHLLVIGQRTPQIVHPEQDAPIGREHGIRQVMRGGQRLTRVAVKIGHQPAHFSLHSTSQALVYIPKQAYIDGAVRRARKPALERSPEMETDMTTKRINTGLYELTARHRPRPGQLPR